MEKSFVYPPSQSSLRHSLKIHLTRSSVCFTVGALTLNDITRIYHTRSQLDLLNKKVKKIDILTKPLFVDVSKI